MKLVTRINTVADKALSKILGEGSASAMCTPDWETYCSPGVCDSGYDRFRIYHRADCTACCWEHLGCC